MKKHLNKFLGVTALSLAAMGAGMPVFAADVNCAPQSGLDHCYSGAVFGMDPSVSDVSIGSLTLNTVSDVFGFLGTQDLTVSTMTLASTGSSVTAHHTVEGFAFDDLASGNYQVSISGLLTGVPDAGVHLGLYDGGLKVIPQIPEPGTYALLLAGLLTLGLVSRRRSTTTPVGASRHPL